MYRSIPILIVAFATAFAQSPQPAFEVASVKPSTPQSVRMFDGMLAGGTVRNPGMIAYTRATLDDLLTRAYDLADREQISGPAWLGTEPYDIFAKIPQGTTTEQFRAMMRRLLEERFKLTVHHLTKDFPVYELAVAKNGPKLKESVDNAPAAAKDGFPALRPDRPGIAVKFEGNRARLAAHQEPLSALAKMLRSPADRQVLDKTGLTGTYDFTLEFSFRELTAGAAGDDPIPSLFEALQQQLGLKLEDKKAPFDLVVVDHAEKVPTEN
jgi:uncharacterized protein (TIGR03435 family)